ncbi:MAG: 1,4-dihydroxy-2-naphthoate octaprenyltransferase [Woeseiaceae bacterium]|nr:1,4-dihydroxy-2-naphthoate octaprenyltransferase [Woeseiaceae bacterium]
MSRETAGPTGPSPEIYAGDTPAATARRLFGATRPKFFPASVLPVLAGTAWGAAVAGAFDASVFSLALLATVCVHAGANVLNDVGDDQGGTDRQNEDRIYPYTGGSQFIQAGIMSQGNMARLGVSLLAVAAVAGLLLLLMRGEMVLWFGLAGVLLAVLYSLGPVRLSSIGLGELSVGIAFGVLPVVGAAWLQSGTIDTAALMFSLPISAWVAAILLINEVPDIAADAATGKRTLAVRLGERGTSVLYTAIHLFAAVIVVLMTVNGDLPLAAPLVPVVLVVLALRAAAGIRTGVADRDSMTKAIEGTLGIHTLGSIWLIACALYLAIFVS